VCGIAGHVGEEDSLPIVEGCLGNLEYRGYDSAGVGLVTDDGVDVYKQQGVIDDLDLPDAHPATTGIGHTRWSTHGKPTDANAHPHVDCVGDVAVVHNGIIENYDELREELDGHAFTSETDTEVVPHLLEDALEENLDARTDGGVLDENGDGDGDGHSGGDDDDLVSAVEDVVDRLEGSYAIAVTIAGPEPVVVARQDSPLVAGHGEDANFVGSDVTAFVA
jgi:glucosamine--fructose-6-phosphate aminotransferase (isomerizing)